MTILPILASALSSSASLASAAPTAGPAPVAAFGWMDLGITLLKIVIIFGGLIIFFLIVEPFGLARLWQIAKEKLRLWPFPH